LEARGHGVDSDDEVNEVVQLALFGLVQTFFIPQR
jgi:hypothetical protein